MFRLPASAAPAVPADPAAVPVGNAPAHGAAIGVIYIPRFGANYSRPIIEGTSQDVLDTLGLGRYAGTAMPGAVGNFVMAGHRQTHGAVLDNIHTLVPGDKIYVQTADGFYTYVFRNQEIVLPDRTDVIAPVPTQPGAVPEQRILTMTSCNPRFGSEERIIAYSVFDSWQPLSAGPPAAIAQQLAALQGKGVDHVPLAFPATSRAPLAADPALGRDPGGGPVSAGRVVFPWLADVTNLTDATVGRAERGTTMSTNPFPPSAGRPGRRPEEPRDQLPALEELLAGAHVVSLPMRVKFRGILQREALLLDGPLGWGEFCPFPEYGDPEASRWLAAAIEAGWQGFPEPLRTLIPVNATVPAVAADRVPEILARFGRVDAVKIKVAEPGQSLDDDAARVAAVRAALPDAAIRVDANGGWDVPAAVEALTRLAAVGLEYAEQPVPDIAGLAEVRRRLRAAGVPVLIAADESVRKEDDPLKVARAGAADLIVVKVAPLGGVRRALDIVAQAGLPAVVSSALDTSVGIRAGLALAAALPELPYACGLGTVSLLAADVTRDSAGARRRRHPGPRRGRRSGAAGGIRGRAGAPRLVAGAPAPGPRGAGRRASEARGCE